jgi:hypothetical protein
MLGTIICIMVFGGSGNAVGCFSGGTDNQSNTFAAQKLLSTKFQLTILLMELSEQLRTRNAALSLRWIPREQNQAADDLTNDCFDKFTASNRIPVVQEDLKFLVLESINKAAGELFQDIVNRKAIKLSKKPMAKRKVTDRLKWRNPW